jgi:hypothetical protein
MITPAEEIRRLDARLERIIAAARRMAEFHHDTCDYMLSGENSSDGYECSCGRAALLAAIDGEPAQPDQRDAEEG